jgi:hypothetical protein
MPESADSAGRQVLQMALEQEILETLRALPADKQQEVLDHARRLRDEAMQARGPRKSGRALLDDVNADLTAEEINQARREMWRNFLRDDF